MPPTNGWATRSSASTPNRRRTKEPRLSSAEESPRGSNKFARHAELAGPRKERGLDKRPEARRCQQEKSFRQQLEFAILHDVDLLVSSLG